MTTEIVATLLERGNVFWAASRLFDKNAEKQPGFISMFDHLTLCIIYAHDFNYRILSSIVHIRVLCALQAG